MRWGFRVATDPRFGAGHLARCRALAAALDPRAILYCDPDDGAQPDGTLQVIREVATDGATHAVAALRNGTVQVLIVDSYSVRDAIVDEAAKAGFVAVFRDGSPYGPETISINPNPGFQTGPTVIGGPAYMPLPARFAALNERASRARNACTPPLAVLVAFGARDSANRTMTALEGLMAHAGRLNVSVAVGAGAAHAAAVAKRASEMKHTELLPEREDLIAAYERFDFAIGAPGVSQFERACCGVPSILIAQNERQVPLARAWAKTGAAMRCDPTPDAVATAVTTLLAGPATLPAMREHGLSLVDGKGATRLADELRARAAH